MISRSRKSALQLFRQRAIYWQTKATIALPSGSGCASVVPSPSFRRAETARFAIVTTNKSTSSAIVSSACSGA